MADNNRNTGIVDFGEVDNDKSIIKVVGVGGGGGNAVNHMFKEGIHKVSFVLCNTDKQALDDSPVPMHLQLGKEGLGAGNRPLKAKAAAEESIEDIKAMFNDGTKMAFITAGMGGGTGTGAAPVIARVSKEMGILTVGIVTIPFRFEGLKKIDQALDGVEEMAKHVDALLVINNERLRQVYPELSLIEAFKRADDTLSVAAKSIAEIITLHGFMNLDFNDVKMVLEDGGVAIMSSGYGEGEGRLQQAIFDALNSPLLNDNDVFHAKKLLLNISFSNKNVPGSNLMMEEINYVDEFMAKFSPDFVFKWGVTFDENLVEKVKVTVLATGFGVEDITDTPQRTQLRTIREAEEAAERAQNELERGRRINIYYGSSIPGGRAKKHTNIYFFRPEDLDNEDVIIAVDESPTYARSQQKLEEIRQLGTMLQRKPVEEQDTPTPTQGTISFA